MTTTASCLPLPPPLWEYRHVLPQLVPLSPKHSQGWDYRKMNIEALFSFQGTKTWNHRLGFKLAQGLPIGYADVDAANRWQVLVSLISCLYCLVRKLSSNPFIIWISQQLSTVLAERLYSVTLGVPGQLFLEYSSEIQIHESSRVDTFGGWRQDGMRPLCYPTCSQTPGLKQPSCFNSLSSLDNKNLCYYSWL